MQKDFSPIIGGTLRLWPGTKESGWHRAELARLLRRGERAWIQLPSALLQTRYWLKAVEQAFSNSETATAIQASLRQCNLSCGAGFNQYYLIAQPHAEASCYNISDYVQRCLAGELSIAERLRGRTVIHLHQTEDTADDLLSDTGVLAFVERLLMPYLSTYGKQALIGFTCELPRFLSVIAGAKSVSPVDVLEPGTSSVPWSPVLSDTTKDTLRVLTPAKQGQIPIQAYLPLVFYETYDSAAVRNAFWREVTTQFAKCFLAGLRDFSHQAGLRFAVSLPVSAKVLEFELGAMLAQVDCPILNTTALDTPRRFAIAKWVCSNAQYAGISRKGTHKLGDAMADASLGFNLWPSRGNAEETPLSHLLSTGFPKRALLMIAPTQSLWTKPDEKLWNQLTKAWGWLCQTVWQLGYDFRIVSEQELSSANISVSQVDKKNRAKGMNPRFAGGTTTFCFPNDCTAAADSYRVVLLPSGISLQEETVNCLKAFTKAKGRLIANEPTPYLLNGRIGLEPYPLEQLIYGRRSTILRGPLGERKSALKKCLRKWVPPVVSVYVKPDNHSTHVVQMHHRVAEAYEVFYFFNAGAEPVDTLIELHRSSKVGRGLAPCLQEKAIVVEEWHLLTGTKVPVDFWHADGKLYLNCAFTPKQGRLFVVTHHKLSL